MPREDRTVRESVQPLPKKQVINQQLAVAGTADTITVTGMEEWRQVTIITSHDVYLGFDLGAAVTPDATNSLILESGEMYYEEGVRVVDRLRILNVNPGEQPTLRGIVWGM